MAREWHSIVAAVAVLLFSLPSARADDSAVTELSDLLADDVRIKLDDLGVVQNKQEFIAAIDEWKGAVAGAEIRHRIEKTEGDVRTVIACYDFPNNDMLMQETFAVTDNRITASSQAAIAENCDAY